MSFSVSSRPRRQRAQLSGAALVTSALIGAASAAMPAAAETLSASYSVRLIGLSLGVATVSGKFDPDHYRIEAHARLAGLAQAVTSAKGAAIAAGVFLNGRVAPDSYATTSSNSKETRTVRIGMNAGNVRAVDISPPFDELPGRVPLGEMHKRNIIDPLSALVMPVAGNGPLLSPDACKRTIPVFDGYTRFDVVLGYVGLRKVAARGYKGPVVVCNARYHPLAGHRPGRKATQFMINNRQMEVWLAPVGNTRVLVPFRISVATMIGTTVIEAQQFVVTAGTRADNATR